MTDKGTGGSGSTDPDEACAALVDRLGSYLERAKEDGVKMLDVSRSTVKELGTLPGASAGRPVPAGARPEMEKEAVARTPDVSPSRVRKPGTPPRASPEHAAPALLAGAEGSWETLDGIAALAGACQKCGLHKTRTRVVPGQGCRTPEVMFVGEAPGYDEDRQGLAFVGAAGQLLTKMIGAMGFTREEVFIGNILKCRPPENRAPLPDEMAACLPYLNAQIALLKPKVIVAMGATAVKGLLGVVTGITKYRGTWTKYEGIDVMPTFHPAYLLRMPSAKRESWVDLKAVLKQIGREPPASKQ